MSITTNVQPSRRPSRRRRRIAAVVLALAAAGAGVATFTAAHAAGSGTSAPSELITITPCRLADTRTGTDNVGPRSRRIGADESAAFAVWGSNGRCAIPASATGVVGNITAVDPSAASFLTIYPGDATRPLAANVNTTAGGSPTPNQFTVGLSATGDLRVYNLSGSVDVVIDVVGYYQPATTTAGTPGPVGPVGPAGPAGPAGTPGAQGSSGISGYELVEVDGLIQPGQRDAGFQAVCPAGKRILGGGVAYFNKDIEVTASTPLDGGTRWVVSTTTHSGNNVTLLSSVVLRVICATVAS